VITVLEDKKVFILSNREISYVMEIEEFGFLAHIYFGKKINSYSGHYKYPRIPRSSPTPALVKDRAFSLDTLMVEYPGFGFGDFREPAHNIKLPDGTKVNDFRYQHYRILKGKKPLEGLPSTYVNHENEAETLEVVLMDEVSNLELTLSYTIFEKLNVISRSAVLKNKSESGVKINKLASCSLDFPARNLDLLHLTGAWAGEFQLNRELVTKGTKRLESTRGASSPQQNPFMALASPNTTEFQGEVFGFSLVYSGNFETIVQKDSFEQTRVILGINSFNFDWQLNPGQSFQSPEVIMVYSDEGLNKMSATFHDLYNYHLVRGKYKLEQRPILINNWEATYMDFDEEKIMKIVEEADKVGIELFVLDDGWFGARNDDTTSLGDWFENKAKLKNGLKGLADKVHEKGMKFGLWFEPEMISEESELFREHPDWAIGIPGRSRSPQRDQYVLDFARKDVRANIYSQMKCILDTVDIDYIKWDMNRNISEAYSLSLTADTQGEFFHRYMLGLYDFLETLIHEYPNILFESCAGGGGRFDAGMHHYMPQGWTSDNTDAIARLKIQYGCSLAYPISTMGSHVSAVPNHQISRNTSLKIRGDVAMSGVFGYELDLTKLSKAEKSQVKFQVEFYKQHRKLLQYGTFYRLYSPYETNDVAWMFISKDKSEALVFYYRILAVASYPQVTIKLAGLDENSIYRFNDKLIGGDELMNIGFYIDPNGNSDFMSYSYYLKIAE